MARDRARSREAQRREEAEQIATPLRRSARRWFTRAVLVAVIAGGISLLSGGVASIVGLVALACLVQGVRLSVEAQKAFEGLGGSRTMRR